MRRKNRTDRIVKGIAAAGAALLLAGAADTGSAPPDGAAAAGERQGAKDGVVYTDSVLRVSAAEAVITFDANGGTGEMDSYVLENGEGTLPACEFSRYGYVFRGWMTDPDGTRADYEELGEVSGLSSMTLYALWEPQMYIIHYDANGAELGSMEDSYGIYDEVTTLSTNTYTMPGHRFSQWIDSNTGTFYGNEDEVTNLHSGNTYSRAVITVDAGEPEDTSYSFKSTQGSCVYEEDGVLYLVTAASINDDAYYDGDLTHYETVLTRYNLETGEVVAQARNLPFDHGNGICYNDSNGHIYIAEGGTLSSYPSGVMEVDENLNYVAEYNFPLLTHIWAIAYADGHFYLIGRNDDSRNSFCVLNEDMQTLSITAVDDYYTNFSSQGIACDGSFIYAVSAGFSTYEWKSRQRINVFSTEGGYLGVWTIDIPYEAEDITVLGPYAYISTNEGAQSTLYRTRIPAVTLTATWK